MQNAKRVMQNAKWNAGAVACLKARMPLRLKIHDPTRRPAEWTAHLVPGQVAAFLADVRDGTELTPEGTRPGASESGCCWVFDRLEDARAWCAERVSASPNLCCEIFDARGRAGPPLLVVTGQKWRRPGQSPRRLTGIAVCLLILAPILFWLDWRNNWLLILPSLAGVYCAGTALRLLAWAWGLRDSERLAAGARGAHRDDATGPG